MIITGDIYDRLIDALNEKKKHLQEYTKAIDNLAKNNVSTTFYTGNCKECERLNSKIKSLAKKILEKL
jgi:hypothetical protein